MMKYNEIRTKMRQEVYIEIIMKQMLPGFANWSKRRREALVQAFEFKRFEPGVPIIEEGQTLTHAFVVIRGEVKASMRSKLKLLTDNEYENSVTLALQPQVGRTYKIPRTSDMKGLKGTLNTKEAVTYELGIRDKFAWVGEEILFMTPNQKFQYSAIARTKVLTFQISRINMLHNMDPDYLSQLIDQATTRYKHIKEQKEGIDSTRIQIGKSSQFSKKCRNEFESSRKTHLQSIEEKNPEKYEKSVN